MEFNGKRIAGNTSGSDAAIVLFAYQLIKLTVY